MRNVGIYTDSCTASGGLRSSSIAARGIVVKYDNAIIRGEGKKLMRSLENYTVCAERSPFFCLPLLNDKRKPLGTKRSNITERGDANKGA